MGNYAPAFDTSTGRDIPDHRIPGDRCFRLDLRRQDLQHGGGALLLCAGVYASRFGLPVKSKLAGVRSGCLQMRVDHDRSSAFGFGHRSIAGRSTLYKASRRSPCRAAPSVRAGRMGPSRGKSKPSSNPSFRRALRAKCQTSRTSNRLTREARRFAIPCSKRLAGRFGLNRIGIYDPHEVTLEKKCYDKRER